MWTTRCSVEPYVGLAHERYELDPALIRVLGYVSGDGHLTRDRKQVLDLHDGRR